MMQRTMRVRIKLSDFIDTKYEDEILELISNVHTDLKSFILLHLWYNEGDDIKLKDFLIRWEDKLHFKTIVKEGTDVTSDEFIFFDILPEEEQQAEWSRFTYQYKDKKNIVSGLKELYNCVKFITSDKPTKKQKRNDYED
jgi:hypothetical protein|tara:strand:+ start:1156 stop:1575 length:420 start_codon:yes stop_codon:yes gene_type:complete